MAELKNSNKIEDTNIADVSSTKQKKPRTVTKTVRAKKEHKSGDLIPCKSVCYGELFAEGKKTGMLYSWSNTGDIREVEYQDLLSWKVLHADVLFNPLIIIMDDDIVEEWNPLLGDIYKKLDNVDLENLFDLDLQDFINTLQNLPKRVLDTVKNTANAKIKDGTLYDLRKIKAMDEIIGTELMMMVG